MARTGRSSNWQFVSRYGCLNINLYIFLGDTETVCKYKKGTWSACDKLTKVYKNSLVCLVCALYIIIYVHCTLYSE